jgi:hypothetical protein
MAFFQRLSIKVIEDPCRYVWKRAIASAAERG